jgi:hypothetical protein
MRHEQKFGAAGTRGGRTHSCAPFVARRWPLAAAIHSFLIANIREFRLSVHQSLFTRRYFRLFF